MLTQTPQWPHFATPLTQLDEVLGRMFMRVMHQTTYCGIETQKNPTDAWIYEELIWSLRPEVILEIGNWHGGHLLKLAHLCDVMDKGEVIGVDLNEVTTPAVLAHPRITTLTGDANEMSPIIHELIRKRSTLIIEDSGHSEWNTLAVLRNFSDLVLPGFYFVVEDTIGVEAMRAVEIFLGENEDFETDRSLEEFGVSWNPMGYLRRR